MRSAWRRRTRGLTLSHERSVCKNTDGADGRMNIPEMDASPDPLPEHSPRGRFLCRVGSTGLSSSRDSDMWSIAYSLVAGLSPRQGSVVEIHAV